MKAVCAETSLNSKIWQTCLSLRFLRINCSIEKQFGGKSRRRSEFGRRRKSISNLNLQSDQILETSEGSDETACPRALWSVSVMEVVGEVDGWEALGKSVLAETEPRSVAEPNILCSSR